MKQGWEIKKLGEVCKIMNGGTPDTKNPEFWDGDNLWITPKDMGKLSTRYVLETERSITDNGLKNSSAKILPVDSVILSSRAPIGHLTINKKPISTNQGCKGLIPHKGLNTLYLYYFLSNSIELLNNLGRGTTFKELSGTKLSEVEIPICHFSEQERIVGILDCAFAKIEALRANAQQNLQNTKDLFQASIENEFRIKSGWTNAQLNSVVDVISGYAFKSGDFVDKGIFQVIRIGNVKQDFLRLTESPIFIDSLDQSILCKSLLQQGDLVITQTGTKKKRDYGFVALVNRENLLLNQRVACVRFKDKEINPQYFLYYSYTEKYKNDFFAQEGGAVGQGNVGLTTIKELNVPFPTSKEEQQSIVKKLDALSECCRAMEENYRQTIAHCNALKQALLTKAFNGEL